MWGALSDERSGVQFSVVLGIAIAVFLGCQSRVTHGHYLPFIYTCLYIYICIEREKREEEFGGGSERHYIGVEVEKTISSV
jgi:hypothetical protein